MSIEQIKEKLAEIFSSCSMSKKEQQEICRKVCRPLRIRYTVSKNPLVCGTAVPPLGKIIVSSVGTKNRDQFISALMHEVCHVLAFRNGKYKEVHEFSEKKLISRKMLASYAKNVLNAEIYVDKMAEKMTRELFPNVKYEKAYRGRREQQWLWKRTESWMVPMKAYLDATGRKTVRF